MDGGGGMDFVTTTAERSLAEGTSPWQIDMAAKYHDGQAIQAERGRKTTKPNASMARRHRQIAAELRKVADEMRALLSQRVPA